jgi:hypothetical protein
MSLNSLSNSRQQARSSIFCESSIRKGIEKKLEFEQLLGGLSPASTQNCVWLVGNYYRIAKMAA